MRERERHSSMNKSQNKKLRINPQNRKLRVKRKLERQVQFNNIYMKLTNSWWGACVAQWVKCPTWAQVMISWFVGSRPHQALCWWLRAWILLWILCLPLSLPLTHLYSVSVSLKNKHKKCFLIYLFLRETETARVGEGQRERERERENPKQAPICQHRARGGARTHEPWDHDLSWNQESDAQPTEPPRRPFFFLFFFF